MTAISVTAEHISNGVAGACFQCPVALAILDAIPGITGVSVNQLFIGIWTDRTLTRADIRAPQDVYEFVKNFDAGRPAEPFTFDLDYPAVTA